MTDGIAVLALDAADYRLVRKWDCDNLLLERHQPIETFAWSKSEPYTPEVWATVATGVMPDEHGIGHGRSESAWDNPLLNMASTVTQSLPPAWRQWLGRPFRVLGAEQSFSTVSNEQTTPFDATLSWPGVDDAQHLRDMWSLADEIDKGNAQPADVDALFRRLTTQECGYLAGMVADGAGCVGAHAHILDIAGHLFSDNPERLREWYTFVDKQVGWLREQVERLVILSDHGMQVSWLDDADPSHHSWESYVAAQGVDHLPSDVVDVAAWLGATTSKATDATSREEIALADEQREALADLGYIQ